MRITIGTSHSVTALAKMDWIQSLGLAKIANNTLLGFSAYYSEAKKHEKAMSRLYREVYDAVISFMANDVHAYFDIRRDY